MSKKDKNFQVMTDGRFGYVICDGDDRTNSVFGQANYKGTGMALCGILYPGQSLESWEKSKK